MNRVKHYKTKACLSCELSERCTKNKSGRFIERFEHMDLIGENKKRINENLELYRKRQAIVEHPYGVIKRQWGFYYIMTKKTIQHATADVGMIFTAYNLRRIFNIVDKNELKKYLKRLCPIFLLKKDLLSTIFCPYRARYFSPLKNLKFEKRSPSILKTKLIYRF